jgi:stage IV sporulation protein FA
MEKEFQFAAVSSWYEERFGKPLALLPVKEQADENEIAEHQYAIPASSRIVENFQESGQHIIIETGAEAEVTAMGEGLVHFVGNKEGFGKTVIIQHADQSESWYGNLSAVNVKLYEYIGKGTGVGTAAKGADDSKGAFYFAIKKGEDFVDPVQVIQFE